jgi:hypothetical protein
VRRDKHRIVASAAATVQPSRAAPRRT